ncbi:CPBP family intramembrane glutamic endopeptidase [Vibrio sp. WXL210]|uniref:CPBP family intramembrane glutamic endopeptidase n=1 Tax=Vibrio sp. WXL210 TaxID=3450709 RepID=UPI003EC4BCB7
MSDSKTIDCCLVGQKRLATVKNIWAVLLSCLFFGLLHWMGGVRYMILTGVVAGGLFTGLYYVRSGVIAPFAAHLALNLIEYIYAYRVQTIAQQ